MEKLRNTKNVKRVGQKFGMLLITGVFREEKIIGTSRSRYLFTCLCDCGNADYIAVPNHLIGGKTKSCGCRKRLIGQEHPTYIGYKEISGKLWTRIKSGAKERNHIFDLDIKDAWELFIKQDRKCSLTGLDIGFDYKKITASLDRIDSSLGYNMNNIQWVHKNINKMKNTFSQTEFIHFCTLVANHCKKIN